MRTGLLTTLLLAVGIISYQEMIKMQRTPKPQSFTYAVGAWSVLGLIAELGAYEIAFALGVGLILAMVYTFVLTGAPLVYKDPGPKIDPNTTKHTED